MSLEIPNIRDGILIGVDEEMIDKDYLIDALIGWISLDDLEKCLHANEINMDWWNK